MTEEQLVRRRTLGWTIIITLAVTVIGVFGTLYFLSATPTGERVRSYLGLNNLQTFTISTTKTQKVVIEDSSAIIDATNKIKPAVVSVNGTSAAVQNIFGFGTVTAPSVAGTGFIVTSDGLIVTNKHVASAADSFTVTTNDGKTYDARVVATDPTNDIALLKVDAHGLPVVDFGDSSKLQIGQWVIAVGNALGELQNSVTVGVVSAENRTAQPSDASGNTEYLYGLLQTDAAINEGNSGGPLVNVSGQVVGMNTAVAGNAQGIGFAIPSNDIQKDLESYRQNNKIIQPYIGVNYEELTQSLAKSLNLSVSQGAYIYNPRGGNAIASGSPAEKAGLQSGDIIIKINDKAITDNAPLIELVRQYKPGDKVTLTIIRSGKTQTVQLTLGTIG